MKNKKFKKDRKGLVSLRSSIFLCEFLVDSEFLLFSDAEAIVVERFALKPLCTIQQREECDYNSLASNRAEEDDREVQHAAVDQRDDGRPPQTTKRRKTQTLLTSMQKILVSNLKPTHQIPYDK